MKMCKCGKANQPTRKYCIRCGASLIEVDELGQEAQNQSVKVEDTANKFALESKSKGVPSPTTGDKWVRPSQVERDRVRAAERHIEKTEFEKAQEAFSKDKSSEGDERMLRASEIRELMTETHEDTAQPVSTQRHVPEVSESPKAVSIERSVPPQAVPTEKDHQTKTMEREPPTMTPIAKSVPASISSVPPEMVKPATSPITPKEQTEPTLPPSAFPSTPEPKQPPQDESDHSSAESSVLRPTEITGMPTKPVMPVRTPGEDSIVRELTADITHYQQQMQQLESELESLKLDHDAERRWLNTVTETKRIRVESLEEDLKKAKDELGEAKKELQNAENRMKKEINEAQRRIDSQTKRIKDAEKARQKREQELKKEQSE
ncbi:MAG: hypothetical protein ACFFED_10485 [Candidatus Thorarchaeota archaeon]